MKRNPRKLKWTKAYQGSCKGDDGDSTFDFEKRRNRPEKYDREVMANTHAMKTVQRIQKAREDRFYKTEEEQGKREGTCSVGYRAEHRFAATSHLKQLTDRYLSSSSPRRKEEKSVCQGLKMMKTTWIFKGLNTSLL